ncbi:MAG: glycosyltransferase [Acidaminococcaceae bacterium]|jgi:glycosyltransferase involved in cell wall biosynthesis|nr:glycosyltransferase [Acidaminococcaceae bacterium]
MSNDNIEPKISIITCVYGAEKYIHKCLDSLIGQSYKNLEFVIVDDGSPDKCPEICDKYETKDARIHLIHQKNAGYGVARNVGLAAATGDFVGFVDPDDWIKPDMMAGMAKAIMEHKADIVVCDWLTYNDLDEEHGLLHTQHINNEEPFEELRDSFLLDKHPNFLCNKLFARRLFSGLTIPPDIVLGDLYVCGEIFARSRKIYYVPQGYYCYRVHASFANTRTKTRRKYGMFMAWREHERVCEVYKFTKALSYCRWRAQKAAISLLTINSAQPYLDEKQLADVKEYLKASSGRKSEKLSVKHLAQWWALEHAPSLCKGIGQLSVWNDEFKQSHRFKK